MSSFSEHLNALIGSQDDPSDNDKRALDSWIELSSDVPFQTDHSVEEDSQDGYWDSVLDVFDVAGVDEIHRESPLLGKLLSKPNVEPLLHSLQSILQSQRQDDSIQEELLEILGFDDFDLVVEILTNRTSVAQEVTDYLLGGLTTNSSVISNGVTGGSKRDHISGLDPEDSRRRMEEALRSNAARPLFTGTAHDAPKILPHVYTSASMTQGNILSHLGTRYTLPIGTQRKNQEDYEEVTIPPAKANPPRAKERSILVSELDDICKGSFPGYKTLNRIQSIVYSTAYQTNENMLVCAPTGAGKTDVAMLAILRVLDQNRVKINRSSPLAATIRKDDFKIIYVAPMKALASEIVRKFSKRLMWLSISVRELTGDMQLTRQEIAETQIIVTTPEKWDVVTRKPTGEGELATKVKLLIIDEVHLLNDDRGAVIETIVARTLRQVESTQSVIRIMGLSATLPNYIDVAEFLSANLEKGLFYFDSSFRPVPLEQHFIGVKGKPGSPDSRRRLDKVTYEKVSELVREGHQVMVFVHARKETVKAAQALREAALAEGTLEEFSCEDHNQFQMFRRDIGRSRNKEMKQLFDEGFGIHHAGMLREDRNMMERMFEARAIKVLCCTATLAWGVNLPAHAVIIKGTQVYDSAKGKFTDLSVLDVLQVFGRAGRPGLESSGVGFICTTEDKLQHYLDAVTSQVPIESRFPAGIIDALNAEIALGTVANILDGVQWLGYTYLTVRIRKNPLQYGLSREQVMEDPHLNIKCTELVTSASKTLAAAGMINFDPAKGTCTITDLGRISAKYYIRHASIEKFNGLFKPKMSEADVLRMLSQSTEFDQIQVRDTEEKELKQFEKTKETVPCDVKLPFKKRNPTQAHGAAVDNNKIIPKGKAGTTEDTEETYTTSDKVNILLQTYISGIRPEDFALVSDQAYVAQNAGRIARALLEIAISRKWANVSAALMGMCKAIEKRLWPFDNPLRQFNLKTEVLYNLERWADDYSAAELANMDPSELGKLVRLNKHHGSAILDAAKQFPTVSIKYNLRPLGFDVLRICVRVARRFNWNSRIHGAVEPFWLWIEDDEGVNILQLSHLIFRQTTDALDADFVVAIPDGKPPPSVTVRFVSDKWLGAEDEIQIPFDCLIMPALSDCHTPRLDLPYLSLSVLRNSIRENAFAYRLRTFNAIQTQAFWSIVRTKSHALLCAPTGCGKSTLVHVAIWETLHNAPNGSWVLVIAPRRSIASEYAAEMRGISNSFGISVVLSNDGLFKSAKGKVIRITTASDVLSAVSRKLVREELAGLKLVVCENLELLDSAYELGVSLLLHATQTLPVRFVGLSNSLSDPSDLAAWLNVDTLALHSFRPRDRDQSLSFNIQTFTIPQSAALFKAMIKPGHAALQKSPLEPAIIFVSSRSQCYTIAQDLLKQCTLETNSTNGYLPEGTFPEQLEHYRRMLQDKQGLSDFVTRGVGFFHEGIAPSDRKLMLEMYAEGLIRVLVVPRSACWNLPMRVGTVVVMGTQYLHVAGEERQLRDYALEELVHMQGRAVRHNAAGHFHLFCQTESRETFVRFLNEGLPLESTLLATDILPRWYRECRRDGRIADRQHAVDALSFTFLARRLTSNPMYYDGTSTSVNELLSRVVDSLEEDVASS